MEIDVDTLLAALIDCIADGLPNLRQILGLDTRSPRLIATRSDTDSVLALRADAKLRGAEAMVADVPVGEP